MIYAIGDIHGQITMLCDLLEKIKSGPLEPEDILVFIGDYVDRGENSCAVIDLLINLKIERPNTVFLRGNHEQLMMDARDGAEPLPGTRPGHFQLSDEMLLWQTNGGGDTLLSYAEDGLEEETFARWWEVIPDAHWQFLRDTEIEFVTDQYHFVHAGLLPEGKYWEGQDRGFDPRLWVREPFLSSKDLFDGRVVVFGHTPQSTRRLLVEKNKIGLDTGAVFGGPLSAAVIDPEARIRRTPSPGVIQADYVHIR